MTFFGVLTIVVFIRFFSQCCIDVFIDSIITIITVSCIYFFSNLLIPGSIREVAKQFLRCVLIKLAPNGIFSELFRSSLKGNKTQMCAAFARL